MVSPVMLQDKQKKLIGWNVDANVGLASPNRDDDVQLVQLGYSIMANVMRFPPALRAIYAQVKPGTRCTGQRDDPLVKAIIAHQASRGGTQDGHVSTIRTASGAYTDMSGLHGYMLIALVNNIYDTMPHDIPRIDRLPSCPGALKAAIAAWCSAP